jgi:hypothetical protein
MDISNNAFTVLTLIVAPAVLTNATSVLALNTANRFGRVVDRSRVVAAEIKGLPRESAAHASCERQLARLSHRGALLIRAQTGLYVAIGSFVAAALIAVCGAMLTPVATGAARVLGVMGLFLGVLAAGSLLYGCLLIVSETRIALVGLKDGMTALGDQRT